jgi:hypothetical protein
MLQELQSSTQIHIHLNNLIISGHFVPLLLVELQFTDHASVQITSSTDPQARVQAARGSTLMAHILAHDGRHTKGGKILGGATLIPRSEPATRMERSTTCHWFGGVGVTSTIRSPSSAFLGAPS